MFVSHTENMLVTSTCCLTLARTKATRKTAYRHTSHHLSRCSEEQPSLTQHRGTHRLIYSTVQFSLSHSSTFAASRTSWTCIIESRVEIHTHEGENRTRLQFSWRSSQPETARPAAWCCPHHSLGCSVWTPLWSSQLPWRADQSSTAWWFVAVLVNADPKKKGTSTTGETGGVLLSPLSSRIWKCRQRPASV